MPGLKKKYIQMSKDKNGKVDFKKAWRLQKANTRTSSVNRTQKKSRSYKKPVRKMAKKKKGGYRPPRKTMAKLLSGLGGAGVTIAAFELDKAVEIALSGDIKGATEHIIARGNIVSDMQNLKQWVMVYLVATIGPQLIFRGLPKMSFNIPILGRIYTN
jgi:hypothetical protein